MPTSMSVIRASQGGTSTSSSFMQRSRMAQKLSEKDLATMPTIGTNLVTKGVLFRKPESAVGGGNPHERRIFPHERNQNVANPMRWSSSYLNHTQAVYNSEHFKDLSGDVSPPVRAASGEEPISSRSRSCFLTPAPL